MFIRKPDKIIIKQNLSDKKKRFIKVFVPMLHKRMRDRKFRHFRTSDFGSMKTMTRHFRGQSTTTIFPHLKRLKKELQGEKDLEINFFFIISFMWFWMFEHFKLYRYQIVVDKLIRQPEDKVFLAVNKKIHILTDKWSPFNRQMHNFSSCSINKLPSNELLNSNRE
jgi:hypothetical protein